MVEEGGEVCALVAEGARADRADLHQFGRAAADACELRFDPDEVGEAFVGAAAQPEYQVRPAETMGERVDLRVEPDQQWFDQQQEGTATGSPRGRGSSSR
jgi:hypothetical protein